MIPIKNYIKLISIVWNGDLILIELVIILCHKKKHQFPSSIIKGKNYTTK